jgi:putative MATE family efflux protein
MDFVNRLCYNFKKRNGGVIDMAKKVDATKGNLTKIIFTYTLPLILSTILQNTFGIADKAVLGNMAGSTAVASIGATSVVSTLIINGAVGLSTGTSIILARFVGQKDTEKIKQTIDTSLITSILIGTVLAVLGIVFSPMILTATGCPAECYDGAVLYMRICLASTPATLFYNYGSAILRTLGDTKNPLLYITVAGIVNVALNVILCIILPQKVMAVALATLASKIISIVFLIRRISRIDEKISFHLLRMRLHVPTFVQIIRFGIPTSLSNLMVPLSNLQITPAINSFGVAAVAGNSTAAIIQGIASAFSSGFSIAATTFVGQNIGANQPERVKQSFWRLLCLNFLITGTLGVLFYLSGRFWLGVILGASETAAIEYEMIRLFYVCLFIFVLAINNILSHSIQAFGYPLFTSISSIAFTLGFRVLWMLLVYPKFPTFNTIMLCYLVSWVLNMILYATFFTAVYRRYTKKGICKKI